MIQPIATDLRNRTRSSKKGSTPGPSQNSNDEHQIFQSQMVLDRRSASVPRAARSIGQVIGDDST